MSILIIVAIIVAGADSLWKRLIRLL